MNSIADKEPQKTCKPKNRRANPIIEDRYMYDTPQFKELKSHSPFKRDDQWHMNMDNKGFALKLSVSQSMVLSASVEFKY
jgi:hypothetical protein